MTGSASISKHGQDWQHGLTAYLAQILVVDHLECLVLLVPVIVAVVVVAMAVVMMVCVKPASKGMPLERGRQPAVRQTCRQTDKQRLVQQLMMIPQTGKSLRHLLHNGTCIYTYPGLKHLQREQLQIVSNTQEGTHTGNTHTWDNICCMSCMAFAVYGSHFAVYSAYLALC